MKTLLINFGTREYKDVRPAVLVRECFERRFLIVCDEMGQERKVHETQVEKIVCESESRRMSE